MTRRRHRQPGNRRRRCHCRIRNNARLARRHARPLEGPQKIFCRARGGGGDDVFRSENRCKIRIFTILYTQAVDK